VKQSLDPRFAPVTVKALVVAGLTLLMLWPLSRVESLVSERQALQHQAYDVIAAGFGGSQILGAPIPDDSTGRQLAARTRTMTNALNARHGLSW
jgi:inner membrane protein involved in colicin E2 resistance